jgi:glycosyltransferase involved in cell wall biosynthesis
MSKFISEESIFIGSFVPLHSALLDNRISIAGNNYQLKLITFLKVDVMISLLPVFLSSKSFFEKKDSVIIHYIGRSRLLFWRLPVLVSFFFETVLSSFILFRSKKKIAFFYNLEPQNILLVLLARHLLKMKTIVIMADYSNFNSTLKDRFFNLILSKITGVVSLNPNINCNNNSVYIHGLVSYQNIKRNVNEDNRKNILLSGSLGETTGLYVALEFARNNPNYNLFICGRAFRMTLAELIKIIEEYSIYNNIRFLGVLGYSDYINVLDSCSICLSLRNPNHIEHQYNFPSKILEYLSFSKIVLSTLIYKGIPENLLIKIDFSAKSLAEGIDYVNSMTFPEVQQKMLYSSEYVSKNFTEEVVVKKISKLL